nr:helix-turn-helix domain-containing protein [Baekduia alba]
MLGNDYAGQDCALARSLEILGERWTLLIVRDAFYGVQRFTDFQVHLDIPKGVLADRLKGLTEDGVLERRPDPAHPRRPVYVLTATGRELWPPLHALLAWGGRHHGGNSRVFLHVTCPTPLDDRGTCPDCGATPGPEDILSAPVAGRRRRRDDPVTTALRPPRRLLDPIAT